jgi:cardiolipin synthase
MICLLSLLAGCQVGPAPVALCDVKGRVPSRRGLALRQVVRDTAVEAEEHPLEEACALLSWPLDYGRAVQQLAMRVRFDVTPARETLHGPPDRPGLDPDALEAVLKKKTGSDLEPGWVTLYPTGDEALGALDNVIDQAVCRIDVLMFLWDNDPLGWDVAHHLAAVASPQKPVRILVDGGANLTQGEPKEANAVEVNRVVCWLSRQPNVHVIRTRNPNLHFDHRKLVLADGRLAWSGGRNFTYGAFFEARDVSYTLTGPLVCQLQTIYETFWRKEGGSPGEPLPPPPPLTEANVMARLVETSPEERTLTLSQAVYSALDFAKHHIYMENPYLTDNRVLLKLIAARRRGVDVRVVMTTSDTSETINSSNKVTMNRLLHAGIRVYHYPTLTHLKATAVDGVWAYVGTGNFDPLSLRHDRELGIAIGSGPVIQELEERVFQVDFNPEWEVKEPLPVTVRDHIRGLVGSLLL